MEDCGWWDGCQSCESTAEVVTVGCFGGLEGEVGAVRNGVDGFGDWALAAMLMIWGGRPVAIGGGVAPCPVMVELGEGVAIGDTEAASEVTVWLGRRCAGWIPRSDPAGAVSVLGDEIVMDSLGAVSLVVGVCFGSCDA